MIKMGFVEQEAGISTACSPKDLLFVVCWGISYIIVVSIKMKIECQYIELGAAYYFHCHLTQN